MLLKKGKFKGYNYILKAKPKPQKPKTQKPKPQNGPQSNINNIYTNTSIYNKSNINQSANIDKSFEHFVLLFDPKFQPQTDTQILNWKKCLDKCVRIDKYNLKDIYLVVKFIRNDDFWSEHFLSLLKLRNQDKNGIMYIHRFMELYR